MKIENYYFKFAIGPFKEESKALLFAHVILDFRKLLIETMKKSLLKNKLKLMHNFRTNMYYIESDVIIRPEIKHTNEDASAWRSRAI